MDSKDQATALYQQIQQHQRAGRVAELSLAGNTIHLRAVGKPDWLAPLKAAYPGVSIDLKRTNEQNYYFLAEDLRPGSGVIRVFGGVSEGPGGTLTGLLSSKDGRRNYFAAAGHVLSNFWKKEEEPNEEGKIEKDPVASIYHYRKGFPATNSTRFLGKLCYLAKKPKLIDATPRDCGDKVDLDIGIVEIRCPSKEVSLKQRTTCYGSFGEWPCDPDGEIKKGQSVMKCGAEETHWTYAVVDDPCRAVTVYGPDGLLYELSGQVILTTAPDERPNNTAPPKDWSARTDLEYKAPFAVPGDSGTMVVDRESKRPLGMLIAGSVLDGRYVMTPIRPLWDFWTTQGLVLLRG